VPTEKVSLSLDHEIVEAARSNAGARGLSGYVNKALRRQLQRDRLIAFVADIERSAGPIAEDVMEQVRREWPERTPRRRSA
jgi:hypothetical protein